MKLKFEASFLRDVKKIREKHVRQRIEDAIQEVETVSDLNSIGGVKKLKGEKNYYRIRIRDYRIGFRFVEGSIIFDRVLDRKEIYKYYPPK